MAGWFQGPLTEIWGVPAFWVDRAGGLLQFVSSMVIIVELVGQQRIERMGRAVSASLKRGTKISLWRGFLQLVVHDFNEHGFRALRMHPPMALALYMVLIAGIAGAILIASDRLEYAFGWQEARWLGKAGIFVASGILSVIAFWMVVPLLTLVLRPVEAVFDGAIALALAMTSRTTTTRVLMLLSVFFLFVGFAMQMAAS